jgi:NIMA (never in mitosis gene a)-related kinase
MHRLRSGWTSPMTISKFSRLAKTRRSDIWSAGCVIYEMATLRPPFRAEDMDGLYKKVIKGIYPKLPSHFSVDMNNLIRLVLQVRPNQRPSCEKLLSLPFMVKRMENKMLLENDENLNPHLLNTIMVPKDLHYLTDKLPEPNYEPIKTRMSNQMDYIKKNHGNDNSNDNSHESGTLPFIKTPSGWDKNS